MTNRRDQRDRRIRADLSDRSASPPRLRKRLFQVLLVWMVFSFLVGALTKFYWGETWFGPSYSVKFAEWGYPSWFRIVVGAGELVGALMLVSPRLRFLGACILAVITSGAVVTHLANQDPIGESVSAPLHLVLSLVVAWVARPVSGRPASR